jgi:lipopolysaccharide/colanic/teichoic acid biosynthesis glycosyltransferase
LYDQEIGQGLPPVQPVVAKFFLSLLLVISLSVVLVLVLSVVLVLVLVIVIDDSPDGNSLANSY